MTTGIVMERLVWFQTCSYNYILFPKSWDHFPCIYALLQNKSEAIYEKLFKKVLEIEPSLNQVTVMFDFEKASLNTLEENFIHVFFT